MPGAGGEFFSAELPDPKDMDRYLRGLDRRVRTRVLKSALRAAAGVYRKAFRSAVRRFSRTGDLARSAAVVVRRARSRRGDPDYYALAGFAYGKFGNPPRTSQDPGVYARFVDKGAVREKRGRVVGKGFFGKIARDRSVAAQAEAAFFAKFRENLHRLEQ